MNARLREVKQRRAQYYAAERPAGAGRVDRLSVLAHRDRLAALVTDDAAWPASLVARTTRLRLRGLLDDLDRLLAPPPAANGGSPA